MPEALTSLDEWLLRTTIAGGIVLLVGTLWMILSRQPVQRQRIGEFALLAALLVALPAAMPSWWAIPGTNSSTTRQLLFGKGLAADELRKQSKTATEPVSAINSIDNDDNELVIVDMAYVLNGLASELADIEAAGVSTQAEKSCEHDCTKGTFAWFNIDWMWWSLRAIGLAYLGLVLVLLVRCSIGYYGLWRYWRQRRPAPAHVHTALAELEPDPSRRPRIGVNSLVHGPVSYGLWKPTILLPPHFCNEGDPEKLRWILAHELTHLRRRDAWGCLLLALGGALYFHVPWFWWMKRHVRLAQEYLADAAAVQTANAVEYAQYLVSLTSLTARPSLASSQAAGVFESPSDLYRRVHMLLHQRSVLQRGAPRWWTLTAAASFLALAACTAGMNMKLHADEPEKKPATLTIVVDDDDKKSDEKSEKKKTLTVTGKAIQGKDGKVTTVWSTDDDKKKPMTFQWQGALSVDKQKAIEEAMKKLEQAMEKLPRQLDGETRERLEEVKKTLKSLKENNVVWKQALDKAKVGEDVLRLHLKDVAQQSDAVKKQVELKVQEAHKLALAHRDLALAAEKEAKSAQEKALRMWKEAKGGDDRESAIKALEKAISDKERALRELKQAEAQKGEARVRNQLVLRDANAAPASKGRLGVVVGDVNSSVREHLDLGSDQGLMINEVIDPSPAWNNGNGLRSSDILLEIGGVKVPADQEKFREIVAKLKEGTVSAVVLRKGKKMTIGGIKLPSAEKSRKVVSDLENTIKDQQQLELIGRLDGNLANGIAHISPEKLSIQLNPGQFTKLDQFKAMPLDANIQLNNVNVKPEIIFEKAAPLAKPDLALRALDADKLAGQLVMTPDDGVARFQPKFTTTSQAAGKPRLGVVLEDVPEAVASQIELPEDRGLFVKDVTEGSAAQKAGILKNDILIEFADKPVTRDHEAFTKMVKNLKPGKYTATVVRKGKEIRIRDITLADPKAADEERKTKAKEWTVESDKKEQKEEKDVLKEKVREGKKLKEDFFPNANRGLNFARAGGNMSVSINNDQFTASKTNDGKTITMTGSIVNGKAEPKNITIKTDDGEKKYKTVKDVPEEDRAEVEKMLTSFKGNVFMWNGPGRFNLGNGQFNNAQFNKQLEDQMRLFERSMKQLGEGNPGFDQMEKQLEELRQQLKKMRGGKNDDDNN